MEIGSRTLMDSIIEFDKYLSRRMRIIAIGGTALTLLGKKASTKDIDFCFINEADRTEFTRIAKRLGYVSEPPSKLIGHGLAVDIYSNGYIFCVQLQPNYAEISVKIRELQKIELYALNPVDLVITKTSRFNDRDREDIITILKNYGLDQNEFVERYIKTMENSMVRDAKDNLLVLFSLIDRYIKVDKNAFEIAKRWRDE
ncbi:TPA: hypothetical protein HA238_01890 [Candidatus Micrarchaeota archaeon]|nr:hypothetical protein [Candidatus Micrarchaeota archaeon]